MSNKYGDIEFERRIFPRFVLHMPFSYKIMADNCLEGPEVAAVNQEFDVLDWNQMGVTVNASQGGLMLYLPEEVAIGQKIKISIAVSRKKKIKNIQTIVKVCWIKKTDLPAPRLYKIGVAFEDISKESLSFLKWFEHLWLRQSS